MATKYRIEINDVNSFDLFKDDKFVGEAKWVGDHLIDIANNHHVHVGDCEWESQLLFKLNQYGSRGYENNFHVEVVE